MKVIRAAGELASGSRSVCVAIGMFDGVHLGHQQVIRQTIEDAHPRDRLALVVTFDRHPNTVIAPAKAPPLVYSLSQKLRSFEALGVQATWLITFDTAFSRIPGDVFARNLARDLGRLHSLCVGSSFTFGHQRSGNVPLLRQLGQELGFHVHGLAAVSLGGRIVSSTRIREAIRAGDLDLAGQMLGRPYALAGTVRSGDQLGRQLGFPTANLDVSGLVLPPSGVYAVCAHVRGHAHPAVLNIGTRPTLNETASSLRVEAHLLDFDHNVYGEEMEVTFVARVRDEQRFPSLDRLKLQIARDIAAARQLL